MLTIEKVAAEMADNTARDLGIMAGIGAGGAGGASYGSAVGSRYGEAAKANLVKRLGTAGEKAIARHGKAHTNLARMGRENAIVDIISSLFGQDTGMDYDKLRAMGPRIDERFARGASKLYSLGQKAVAMPAKFKNYGRLAGGAGGAAAGGLGAGLLFYLANRSKNHKAGG